jgi:hypothetical protein
MLVTSSGVSLAYDQVTGVMLIRHTSTRETLEPEGHRKLTERDNIGIIGIAQTHVFIGQ